MRYLRLIHLQTIVLRTHRANSARCLSYSQGTAFAATLALLAAAVFRWGVGLCPHFNLLVLGFHFDCATFDCAQAPLAPQAPHRSGR